MRRIQSSGTTEAQTYTYRDESGTEQFVVYQYLADRNWIFMVRDKTDEVYGTLSETRFTVGLICAAVTVLIILCLILMMRRVGRNLVTVERALSRLVRLELEAGQKMSGLTSAMDNIAHSSTKADLMNRSIQDVHTGMSATTQAADIMRVIDECTDAIKEQIHRIAAASTLQSDMIASVSSEIEEISHVIQDNSAAVHQSVDTLHELSGQAKDLDTLVGQFQIGR